MLAITAVVQASEACTELSPRVESPDSKYSASVSSCPAKHGEESAILTVFDAKGEQTLRSAVQAGHEAGENCVPRGELQWLDGGRVVVQCRYDSQLNGFIVMNVTSGSVESQYTGLWFQASPDKATIATVGVNQRYAAPEGSRCCLVFNNRSVYPAGCSFEGQESAVHSRAKSKNFLGDEYSGIHSFLTVPVWSPDGHTVAFVEKIFDFHYDDPYNRDFIGRVTGLQFYLALVSTDGTAVGYKLGGASKQPTVEWLSNGKVSVDGQTFDREAQPPTRIP